MRFFFAANRKHKSFLKSIFLLYTMASDFYHLKIYLRISSHCRNSYNHFLQIKFFFLFYGSKTHRRVHLKTELVKSLNPLRFNTKWKQTSGSNTTSFFFFFSPQSNNFAAESSAELIYVNVLLNLNLRYKSRANITMAILTLNFAKSEDLVSPD